MSGSDLQHDQRNDHTAEAQSVANQRYGQTNDQRAARSNEHLQTLADMRAQLSEGLRQMSNRHAKEDQELLARHASRHQEMLGPQASERATTNPTQDVMRRAQQTEGVDQFKRAQVDQLRQRQGGERAVLDAHARAVADMERRHQSQLAAIQRLSETTQQSPAALERRDQAQANVVARQNDELSRLQATVAAQRDALRDHFYRVEARMDLDNRQLGAALAQQSGAQRQDHLDRVLTEQQSARSALERDLANRLDRHTSESAGTRHEHQADRQQEVSAQAFLQKAQQAFMNRFSKTQELKNLWEQAAAGLKHNEFGTARSNFWRLVNTSQSSDAEFARKMLASAGYELQSGNNAPLLKMAGWDHRDTRELADRRLTIDHAAAQSHEREQALSSENLRFMTQRDNAIRGNRFTADDRHVRPEPWQAELEATQRHRRN